MSAHSSLVTDRRLREFFAHAESCFREAASRCGGPIVVDHRIAGRPVRMQFAGQGLLSAVGRAFGHLGVPTDSTEPELTISLWDSRISGVAMPRPPWSLNDYSARGDIRGHNTPDLCTSYHMHSGVLNMADLEAGRAIYWIKDAAAVPRYAMAAPLLPILHWWMSRVNIQVVHAGAVGTSDGAALLAGQGGAGKSNTALSCLESGVQYISDDFCLVQLDPLARAHSIFCTGRLRPPDVEALAFLKPFVSNPSELDSDKALFFLHECLPDRVAVDLPLRVILLPRVSGQRSTTWEAAAPAVAHRALTAVTLHYLPGAGQAALETIARAVRQLPCYFLNLGTDRRGVPPAIRTILSEVT